MSHNSHTSRRGMAARSLGMILSMLALLVIGSIIAFTTIRGAQRNQQQTMQDQQDIEPAVMPTNRPPVETGEIQDLIQGSSQGKIQLVNEDNEVVQELLYDTFNPREAGRFNVTLPEAWLYMSDGSSVSIHADELNYVQPSGSQEPEKGRFSGNVRIRVFPLFDAKGNPAPRAGDDPDALGVEPVTTINTESLTFDSAIGELSTADPVSIFSTGIEAHFVGLTLVVDERNKRLAYLEAQRDGRVIIDPEALQSRPQRPATSDDSSSDPGQPEEPVRQQYHVAFADQVRFVSDTQSLDADRLHVWATLVDGKLPEGAIAPMDSFRAESTPVANASTHDAATSSEPQLIHVTWKGPLTVRPVLDPIAQLEHDDVAIRFESPESGIVAVSDSATGAALQAVAIVYGMTTRNASLIGAGETGVRVRLPGQADVLVGRLDANLTTGKAVVNGPGEIRALDPNAQIQHDQRITWQDGGEFQLATRGGQVDLNDPILLREALLKGAAEARRDNRGVQGELIRAWFDLTDDRQPSINRLLVEGNARADAGADGQLSARRIDVTFDPNSTLASPAPSELVATGAVRATQGDALIESELLEASLTLDPQGNPLIDKIHASLGVNVRTPQGDEVTAEDLTASVQDGIYNLTGQPVVLRREELSVSGTSIRLEEQAQRMTVFGAGVLQSSRRSDSGAGYENMHVAWEDSMLYDGVEGFAEFIGNAQAEAQLHDAKDFAKAQRIVVTLQPDAQSPGDDDPVARDVIQAINLYGAVVEGTGDELVTVESRRYTPDPTRESGVRLEGLMYLESEHVEADVLTDTLRVPQQGKLLIENRSEKEQDLTTPPTATPFDGQGTTLFTWGGTMELRRSESRAIFRDSVQLRHLPPGSSAITELECELLDAAVDLPGSPGTVGLERTQLRSARASGAVYVRRGTKQLIADTLVYDATNGIAEATASLGNMVTMFDAAHPTPLTGSLLRWDVVRDRVEWRDAGETTVPRK